MIIVHAPSRRDVKGTRFILKAVNELRSEGYNFEFRLVEKVSRDKALKLIKEADVVIDQLIIGWYGMVTIEAMSAGKPVICYISQDLLEKYKPPIIPADKHTIKRTLKDVLDRKYNLKEIGIKAREYYNKVHSPRKVCDRWCRIYSSI